jgi:periplasmic copper chaperone A
MRSRLAAFGLAFSAFVAAAGGAASQGSDIQIKDVWARATPGGAQTAAIYVTMASVTGDRLASASTPVAQTAELHTMTMDNGVMKMRQVDGIDLPAGQTVTLKPGRYHIMLTGLAQPLKDGQTFPLTLTFAKAGAQQVTVSVQKVGATGPGGETGNGMNMPGMDMPMKH